MGMLISIIQIYEYRIMCNGIVLKVISIHHSQLFIAVYVWLSCRFLLFQRWHSLLNNLLLFLWKELEMQVVSLCNYYKHKNIFLLINFVVITKILVSFLNSVFKLIWYTFLYYKNNLSLSPIHAFYYRKKYRSYTAVSLYQCKILLYLNQHGIYILLMFSICEMINYDLLFYFTEFQENHSLFLVWLVPADTTDCVDPFTFNHTEYAYRLNMVG